MFSTRSILLSSAWLIYQCSLVASPVGEDSLIKKPANPDQHLCRNVVGWYNPMTACNANYVFDQSLYELRVDTLPQVRFWRSIMNMHQDTAIICIGSTRQALTTIALKDWNLKTDSMKRCYRDSVKYAQCLDSSERILITTGKRFFYDFNKTSLNFDRGIKAFIDNGVDPWFCQAILLIESPNKLQKSNVGAYGPFQLMKDVARKYGLRVNSEIDERADFERSAYAASCLIKQICIPYANKMLDSLHITGYTGTELWYKLLVMHVYHAGYYNVQKALYTLHPQKGDMSMIYSLWNTSVGKFKMASQNYTQLILAAMLEMDDRSGVRSRASFD